MREIFRDVFGPKNTYLKNISKIFKYSNILYTYTKADSKVLDKDDSEAKDTISWTEKNKDNYFDYIFPCSKANEQQFLKSITQDPGYREDVTRDYPQAKVSVYCAHPFYSPSSNIIFSNFKSRSIKREPKASKNSNGKKFSNMTNNILTTFLNVVKNPAYKKQDADDFKYYLFDLCLLYTELDSIIKIIEKDKGNKQGFIDKDNKHQFIYELNKFSENHNKNFNKDTIIKKIKDLEKNNKKIRK